MTVIVTIVKESNRIATERTVNVDVDHALPHGMKAHLKGLAGANIKKKKKKKSQERHQTNRQAEDSPIVSKDLKRKERLSSLRRDD